MTCSEQCKYYPILTSLKRVYLVKRSLYIYSTRNILPYPMWDITLSFSFPSQTFLTSRDLFPATMMEKKKPKKSFFPFRITLNPFSVINQISPHTQNGRNSKKKSSFHSWITPNPFQLFPFNGVFLFLSYSLFNHRLSQFSFSNGVFFSLSFMEHVASMQNKK